MRTIELMNGRVAMIDDGDLARVSELRWRLDSRGYARATLPGTRRQVLMHRYILNAPADADVDHRNGNRLDNRRSNLRVVSRSQNAINRAGTGRARSIYKGVEWDVRMQKWRAVIMARGVRHRSGYFVFENEAARQYNVMAQHYHGRFARLNDVPKDRRGRRYPGEELMLEFE